MLLNADTKEIETLKAENSAWYKSPYLWTAVGLVVGAYVARH